MVLTVDECARRLAISRSACYEAIGMGSIPAIRVGKRSIRVPVSALERMLDVQPTADPPPTIGFVPAKKRSGGKARG